MKDHSFWFSEKKNGWWGRPLVPEILEQTDAVGAKTPIFNRYSLVYGASAVRPSAEKV